MWTWVDIFILLYQTILWILAGFGVVYLVKIRKGKQ